MTGRVSNVKAEICDGVVVSDVNSAYAQWRSMS